MRAKRRQTREEIKQRSRATKEHAETEGIGTPEDGIRLPVPSNVEDDQASFLGVEEPVLDADERGEAAPSLSLPSTKGS